MAGFTLPDSAVPEWAKAVPEDVWKGKLVESLNDGASKQRKKKKKRKKAADAAAASADISTSIEFQGMDSSAGGSEKPERRRRLSFSRDDEELMNRVRHDVGLESESAPVNGDADVPNSEVTPDDGANDSTTNAANS